MSSVSKTRIAIPLAAACALVALLAFSGCTGTDKTTDATSQDNAQQTTAVDKLETDAHEVIDAAHFDARLVTLTNDIDTTIASVSEITVPDNESDRPSAYFDALEPLKGLEERLSVLEDDLKAAHHDGKITHDEAVRLEREVKRLEHLVDDAKDSLAHRMGIDD